MPKLLYNVESLSRPVLVCLSRTESRCRTASAYAGVPVYPLLLASLRTSFAFFTVILLIDLKAARIERLGSRFLRDDARLL